MDELSNRVLMKIEKTKFFSKKIGNIAKGCQQCVKGQKLVLFVTGICPRKCYYCPISDKKYQHDVVYANEKPVKNIHQIIEEAKFSGIKAIEDNNLSEELINIDIGNEIPEKLYTSVAKILAFIYELDNKKEL